MTRVPRADHAGVIGPAEPRRTSAAHMARTGSLEPTAADNSSVLAELRTIVVGLSWPKPTSTERARSAIEALGRTYVQLAAIADTLPDAELRAALAALVGSAGFVLDYWPGALDAIAPQAWTAEHEAGLTADLRQIAVAGAPVLDHLEIPARPAYPVQPGEDFPATRRTLSARHRRDSHEPGPAAPPADTAASRSRWTDFAAGFAADPHRQRAAVVCGAGLVMLALAAGWYLKYDMHHPGGQTPRPTGPGSTATAGEGAHRPTAASSSSPVETATAAASSATVTSVQIELLGSSEQVPQIVVELVIDTATSGAFQLQATWGRPGAASSGRETRVLAGATSYDFTLPIPAADLCGGPVVVQAQAGAVSASTSTVAGPCAPSASSSSPARN